ALAVAEHHLPAAFFAFDGGGNRLGFWRQRIAVLVEVDDGFALRISGAAEELAEASFALDHFLAALGAFVVADFAHLRLALLIDGLCAVAGGVAGAGEKKSVLADAIAHRPAALLAVIGRWRAAGVIELVEGAFDVFVERAVEILEQLHPIEMLFLDLVELELHASGELDVHDL